MSDLTQQVAEAEWDHDLATGRIPLSAYRPMTPEERSSGVNFAEMHDSEQTHTETAKAVLRDLVAPYARWLGTMEAEGRLDLALDALALDGSLSAPELLAAARSVVDRLYRTLDAAAVDGWCSAYGELPLDGPTANETAMRLLDSLALDQTAWRLAAATLDALAADSRSAIMAGVDPATALLALKLANISAAVRTTVVHAHRQARLLHMRSDLGVLPFADYGYASMIYASELLDTNTCKTCRGIDGHTYRSMEEALSDYPHGTFRRCEAGPRCRGTLVIVWSSETDSPPARPKFVEVAERRRRLKADRAGWIEHRHPGDIKPSLSTMTDHEWLRPDADGFSMRRTHKVRVRMIDGRNFEAQEFVRDRWTTVQIGWWSEVSKRATIGGILPPGYSWTFSEDTCTYYLKGGAFHEAQHPRVPKGSPNGGEFTSGHLAPINPTGSGASLTMDAIPADKQEKVRAVFADRFGTPEECHRNLVDLLDEAYAADPKQALADARWYDDAHSIAVDLAHEYRGKSDADLDNTVATIASLSPGKQWDQNVQAARIVLEATRKDNPLVVSGALRDAVNLHIRHDNENAMAAYEAKVTSFKTGQPWVNRKGKPQPVPKSMPKHPLIISEVDRDIDVNTLSALGPGGVRAAALAVGKHGHVGVKSYEPLMASMRVQAEGPESLRGPKVRTFFNNIRHPEVSGDTTNDTWHFRALKVGARQGPEADKRMTAIDLKVSEYTGSPSWLGASIGVHPMISDITRAATVEFNGMHGLDLKPHEAQALIWMHMRRKFPLQAVRDLHAEQAGEDEDTFKSFRGNATKAAQAKARQAAGANLSEGNGLLPTYWGDDDPDTWFEDIDGEPFDIEPGTLYKSTYDLYDPSQPRVPKGSPNGGEFAGKTMSRSGKRVPAHETSQTPAGVMASDLRIEDVTHSWPIDERRPQVVYRTPGGSRIIVRRPEGGVRVDPPDPDELGDIASTADTISARTGRPVDVNVHTWTMRQAGAVGWYDADRPGEININLSESRNTVESLRERQKAKGALAQEEWRVTAEWHSPVAMHVSPIAYTTAHEMGHDYDYAHPAQRKRRAAAGEAIKKYIVAHEGQDRPLGWATTAGLSQYASFGGANEWYAECFAEWMLTGGKTDVPASRLFGEMLGWP